MRSPVALVLCGGGSGGAMEVGFYRAVRELGITVDFILGSSIGALNGACIAAGLPDAELAELWCAFRLRNGVSLNWAGLLTPGRCPGCFTFNPLRRRLHHVLPATRFEELRIPLHVVGTDLQLGTAVYWSGTGDLVEPVIASMTLPGLFPPVEIDGHQFVDGGIANNVPLDRAIELGARTVLMVSCACCELTSQPFQGALRILARSFSIALDRKFAAEFKNCGTSVRIHQVRPRFAHVIDLLDFGHTAGLIDAAYRQTIEYFNQPDTSEPAVDAPGTAAGASTVAFPPARTS